MTTITLNKDSNLIVIITPDGETDYFPPSGMMNNMKTLIQLILDTTRSTEVEVREIVDNKERLVGKW